MLQLHSVILGDSCVYAFAVLSCLFGHHATSLLVPNLS